VMALKSAVLSRRDCPSAMPLLPMDRDRSEIYQTTRCGVGGLASCTVFTSAERCRSCHCTLCTDNSETGVVDLYTGNTRIRRHED
jgi:hypothetical protein